MFQKINAVPLKYSGSERT